MTILSNLSNQDIITELGHRLRSARVSSGYTIKALAARAGLTEKTIRNFESGQSVSLASLIMILAALSRLHDLEPLLEDYGPSPIAIAKMKGRVRKNPFVPRKRRKPNIDKPRT